MSEILLATDGSESAEAAARIAIEVAKATGDRLLVVTVEAETILRHGSPSREICAVARERKPRLIVIGSQGWSAMERAVFGSVSESVLHHAPCAVLVVPADEVLARRT